MAQREFEWIECAVEAKAKYIISGDRHPLNLIAFGGIEVLTADGFLRQQLGKTGDEIIWQKE